MSQGLHFICLCACSRVQKHSVHTEESHYKSFRSNKYRGYKMVKNCDSDAGWSTRLTRSCFILLHDNISADLSVHCRFCWMLFRMFPYTKLYSCSLDLVPSSCTTSTPESSMIFVCLTYMGQTCPSNRPGGSGKV